MPQLVGISVDHGRKELLCTTDCYAITTNGMGNPDHITPFFFVIVYYGFRSWRFGASTTDFYYGLLLRKKYYGFGGGAKTPPRHSRYEVRAKRACVLNAPQACVFRFHILKCMTLPYMTNLITGALKSVNFSPAALRDRSANKVVTHICNDRRVALKSSTSQIRFSSEVGGGWWGVGAKGEETERGKRRGGRVGSVRRAWGARGAAKGRFGAV